MRSMLLIAVLVACGGNRVDDPGATTAASTTTHHPPAVPPSSPTTAPAPPPAPATTTFMPTIKFREHAAKLLRMPIDDLEGGALNAAHAASMPQSVGNAWANFAHPKGNTNIEIRGWVMADGRIITGEQNLGLLFAEAGLWKQGRTERDDELADKLAALLAWSYGYGYTVIDYRDDGMAPPTLTMKRDGSGELVFFTNYKRPGPGGAGGGPDDLTEHRVVFGADQTATLTKTKKP